MKDFEKRKEEFIKKYGELVKELSVDMAAYPVFVPNKEGTFTIIVQSQVVDIKKSNDKFISES